VALLALVVSALSVPAGATASVPELFTSFPGDRITGEAAGRLHFPGGIAVEPELPGHLYVADTANNRIGEFTPWGSFVKAFGWGVRDGAAELQTCTADTGCQKGLEGSGAGQLKGASQVAVDAAGDVYVLEGGRGSNLRVQRFAPDGSFLSAFGSDVVAHGPGDSANDEVQELIVAASGGSFKLSFTNPFPEGGEDQTAALPYNASAAEVEEALNELATIGGIGGSVAVSDGPGDGTGSSPYLITFESNLGGDDLRPLKVDRGALADPTAPGYSLECGTSNLIDAPSSGGEAGEVDPSAHEYQWLRNGAPIPGATARTYTTTAADEGKAIQCRATARTAETAVIRAPTPANIAPPEGPVAAPTVNANAVRVTRAVGEFLTVGGAGGQTLSCDRGTWSGAESFAYSWYRNGALIPGAGESTYTVTAADVVSPAYFQCAVSAGNAGTAVVTAFSLMRLSNRPLTTPPPSSLPGGERAEIDVTMDPPTRVITAHQGGGVEVCDAAAGDACKTGRRPRVGEPGEQLRESADSLAVNAAGEIFVGDGEAIKVFEPGGTLREQIAMPAEVASIALDTEGKLYASFSGSDELRNVVRKLEPAGPEAQFIGPSFETEEGSAESLALDVAGHLYVTVSPFDEPRRILEFDPAGNCVSCGADGEGGEPGFDRSPGSQLAGIATGAACGPTDIYVSHRDTGFGSNADYVKIFGPHPDTTLCPPPTVPPSIEASYAASVDSGEAELAAEINPHFWGDTTYYLEYGTAPCSEGGCQAIPSPPGRLLSKEVTGTAVTATVFLAGLQPRTTYHYRFVAAGSGSAGEPVRGTGGTPGAPGAEATFTTFAPTEPVSGCSNDSFRTGPGAYLPDCRAYELVSPLDKNNGNVAPNKIFTSGGHNVPAGVEQSSLTGDRLAYSSATAFADAVSSPWTSQYIAQRIAGSEWRTHAISPPQGRLLGLEEGIGLQGHDTEFRVFSPDLCEAWLRTTTDAQLAPGAVPDSIDLYRRSDRLCAPGGADSYEALTTISPPDGELGLGLELQGVSADRQTALYNSQDSLAGTGAPAGLPGGKLYVRGAGGQTRFACVMPWGAAVSCLAGTTFGGNPGFGNYWAALAGAISEDGSRVFWSTPALGGGAIYVRENPLAQPSAQEFGSATGSGRRVKDSSEVSALKVAEAKADLSAGSPVVVLGEALLGQWAVGQPLSGSGIAAGATVEACSPECGPEPETLTLSEPATADKSETRIRSAGPEPFAAGQEVVGEGIAAGTTIVATKEGGLTLSEPASADTEPGAPLEAFSRCTEAEKACTVPVSAEGEELSGTESSRFLAAASDGSRAIFLTQGKNKEGEAVSDFYEFDLASRSTQKFAGQAAGILGTSADASVLYFLSEEAIPGSGEGAPGSASEGRPPQPGDQNLYRYEAGAGGGAYRFIGRLAEDDAKLGAGEISALSPVSAAPVMRGARVSADGRHLAFTSLGRPTDYDNTDQASGEPAAEAYLYDAGGAGRLLCASCNPSGARPKGARVSKEGRREASRVPGWANSFYAPRTLSADGSRLFFESYDALTPRDSNGAQDVYQWEAPGAGDCTSASPAYSPRNGGCVSLISSGANRRDSEFRDADPSGRNVFFATLASLLPQDYGLVDVYDARAGGGLPGPAQASPGCEGEACQSPSGPPPAQTPASAAFRGPGNLSAAAGKAGCARSARRAKRLSRRARALRRRADGAPRGKGSPRRTYGRAQRLSRRAKGMSKRAKRCRRASRRRAR
jgi:hypothetical protein